MSQTPAKYHCCIVSDVDDGAPQWLSSNELPELKRQAHMALLKTKSGWCYFMIDGVRCVVSAPQQTFSLRLPDGKLEEISSGEAPVFADDGAFNTLLAVPNLMNGRELKKD